MQPDSQFSLWSVLKIPTLLSTRSAIADNLLAIQCHFLTGHHVLQLWNKFSAKHIPVLKSLIEKHF